MAKQAQLSNRYLLIRKVVSWALLCLKIRKADEKCLKMGIQNS